MGAKPSSDVRWLTLAGDYLIAHTRIGTLAFPGWAPRRLTVEEQEAALAIADSYFAREAHKYRVVAVAIVLLWIATITIVTFSLLLGAFLIALAPKAYRLWSLLIDGLVFLPVTVYVVWAIVVGPRAIRDSVAGTRGVHELVTSSLAGGASAVRNLNDVATRRDLPRAGAMFRRNPRLRAALQMADQ